MGKIKLFFESDKGKDILIVIIVILVGLGSFELGRLSKEGDSTGIKIEYDAEIEANAISSLDSISATSDNKLTSNSQKNFFASSKGSKYYTLSCSAGKTIKQENRIYFMTGEEAEGAGYELSSSCD